MKFRLNNEEATFNICRSIKPSGELQTVFSLSYWVQSMYKVKIEENLAIKAIAVVTLNLASDGIEEYGCLVAELERNEYR